MLEVHGNRPGLPLFKAVSRALLPAETCFMPETLRKKGHPTSLPWNSGVKDG